MDFKITNFPGEKNPFTTVLRKQNSKYDIIPYSSNVSSKYKKMAGLCYFRTNRTHTSTKKERLNQDRIVQILLEETGFSKTLI